MIETLIMTASLVILGYAIYVSSRIFWSHRNMSGMWKWVYMLITAFLVSIYFLFSIVLISFLASFNSYIFDVLNFVLGIYLLSGTTLIGVILRYHASTLAKNETNHDALPKKDTGKGKKRKGIAHEAVHGKTAGRGKVNETGNLEKEIKRLESELETSNKLNRLAVGREMRIIELKNEIKKLKE